VLLDSFWERFGHACQAESAWQAWPQVELSLELEFQTKLYDSGPILLSSHNTKDGI
jgi:hypothetical protein